MKCGKINLISNKKHPDPSYTIVNTVRDVGCDVLLFGFSTHGTDRRYRPRTQIVIEDAQILNKQSKFNKYANGLV